MTCGSSRRRSLRKPARSSACGCESGRTSSAIPSPRDPALINQFIVEDAAGRKPVVGRTAPIRPASARGRARLARHRLPKQPEPGRADRRQVQSVPERGRARGDRRAEGPPQPDRRECARAVFALREEPGAFGIAERRRRATGRLAFTLELVAERNPYAIGARSGSAGPLDVRGPSAGRRAGGRDEPRESVREADGAHDKDGRVRFRLPARACG